MLCKKIDRCLLQLLESGAEQPRECLMLPVRVTSRSCGPWHGPPPGWFYWAVRCGGAVPGALLLWGQPGEPLRCCWGRMVHQGARVLLQVVRRGSGQGWCIHPSGHRALVVRGATEGSSWV